VAEPFVAQLSFCARFKSTVKSSSSVRCETLNGMSIVIFPFLHSRINHGVNGAPCGGCMPHSGRKCMFIGHGIVLIF